MITFIMLIKLKGEAGQTLFSFIPSQALSCAGFEGIISVRI